MMSYDNINLEKGMFKSGKSLTEVLESIDPSVNYRGTIMDGLDAFSRQLKRFDIKVSGEKSDTVEKFFLSSQSAVLFPEYVRRCVEVGIDESNQTLKRIVATTTQIDGFDYRSVESKQTDSISDDITSLKISTKENLCKLHKRGRMLQTSYESLRFQRIDVFSIILKQIGRYISKVQLFDAFETIESAVGFKPMRSTLTVKHNDIWKCDIHDIGIWLDMYGFKLNTLLGSEATVEMLLKVFGNLVRNDDGDLSVGGIKIIPSYDCFSCKVVGMDSDNALEMVKCGEVEVDYDKLIDKQFRRAAVTCCAGFSVIQPEAIVIRKW